MTQPKYVPLDALQRAGYFGPKPLTVNDLVKQGFFPSAASAADARRDGTGPKFLDLTEDGIERIRYRQTDVDAWIESSVCDKENRPGSNRGDSVNPVNPSRENQENEATSNATTQNDTPDVRQSVGYQPKFDLDVKVGRRGESYLQHIIIAMLHGDTGTIEVKTDERAVTTGNVYIEYLSNGKPSGIARTQATLWATIIGGVVVIIPTVAVKAVTLAAVAAGNIRSMGRGSHPTVGAVIPIAEFIALSIKAAPSIEVTR